MNNTIVCLIFLEKCQCYINNTQLVSVPPSLTKIKLPLDVTVNGAAKHFMKKGLWKVTLEK